MIFYVNDGFIGCIVHGFCDVSFLGSGLISCQWWMLTLSPTLFKERRTPCLLLGALLAEVSAGTSSATPMISLLQAALSRDSALPTTQALLRLALKGGLALSAFGLGQSSH